MVVVAPVVDLVEGYPQADLAVLVEHRHVPVDPVGPRSVDEHVLVGRVRARGGAPAVLDVVVVLVEVAEVEQHRSGPVAQQVPVHGVLPLALGVLSQDVEVRDARLVRVEVGVLDLLEVAVVEAGVLVRDLDVQPGPAVDVAGVLVD